MNNRERLIQLLDILFTETDEEHPLTLSQIKDKLELRFPGETVGLSTVANDMTFLRDRIWHVPKTSVTSSTFLEHTEAFGVKTYCYPRDQFESHEIRVLIDAVASASFLTLSDSTKLIDKLKGLTSRHIAFQSLISF